MVAEITTELKSVVNHFLTPTMSHCQKYALDNPFRARSACFD